MPATKRPRLSDVLDRCRSRVDESEFKQLVVKVFAAFGHPAAVTDEEMLYHPAVATKFCKKVRRLLSASKPENMPDDVILRTLVNCRKQGLQTKSPAPKGKPPARRGKESP